MFDGIFAQLPAIVKARQDGDRRLVEVCASSQDIDGEGDVILQAALLGSADSFIKTGALDEDHLSEIGSRIGIADPASYLIGVPLEVKDLGDGKTGVLGELHRGRPRADAIWAAMTASPPIPYQASIYGFPEPDGIVDARTAKSQGDLMGAKRFLVSKLSWRSLALTRNPVNSSLDKVKVLTVKSYSAIMKSRMSGVTTEIDKAEEANGLITPVNYILPPRNREELMGHYLYHIRRGCCPFAGGSLGNSIVRFTDHFMNCCGEAEWDADMKALALMHLLKRELKRE